MRAARPFKALSLNLLVALAAAGAAGPFALAATPPQTLLIAELAEDENVEDIEHSEPRQAKPAQPASAAPEQALPTVSPIADPADTAPDTARQGDGVSDGVGGGAGGGIDGGVHDGTAAGEAVEQPAATADAPIEPAPATALQLLGAEVPPGTSTRLAWSPAIQIAGLSQPTPVLVINGANPGPTLCLTGAVHGDELNGIEIIRRTVYDVVPEKLAGRVVGIPIVNLPGFQQGTRYLPDRRDLNRHFPGSADGSLADRIAHSLFESVIRHCDMLVDIHTGSLKRTNLPQLRADMNVPAVADFTRGFDRIAVVHSTGTPGMLRTAAVDAGIRAVTLEAGESHRIQEHQIEAGVNSLTSLMEKQGMISRMFVWGDPEPVYYDSNWIRAEQGGILFSEVELGDRVTAGQIMGYVADPITNAQHPIRATSKGRVIGMAVDQVVMAGFAAYHVGTEAEVPGE
ncbi:succinylglutamate desuccinylase/aspartoacylase family protein [Marinobacter sp.]|uniref:succinylglutamate desuccinylase/aspartoacylase family protein n=1 Tax=Marinobacter sp. TaxID=50741 RepID=UPI0019B8CB52|nr:succinylglutamate desuccinylase/aspartoacylase family protein [Marinobacter sp.]MBD3657281.1 succinylglutamate desuccinylase/aspartoacylase family protein [Marinobacter sp.]